MTFQQKDGELFFEACEHFNELLLRCPNHNFSQDNQVLAFYDPNKSLVDLACGGMLMERSCEEAVELFETLSENSQQFPSKGRQGLKEKCIHEESTNCGIQAKMATTEQKLDMLVKVMTNHSITPVQQVTQVKVCNITQVEVYAICFDIDHTIETCPMFSFADQESFPINWSQQYQEEECQSQFVSNPNGQYIEEECTYYHEQKTTTPGNEETVEEIFCEPSLEDPLGERFDQFGGDLDLDKLLEHVETFNEPSFEDPLGEHFDQIGCDLS